MADDPFSPPVKRSTMLVALSLVIVLALFLIISTGVRWLTQRTPSSILVLHGSPAINGSQIILTRSDSLQERHSRMGEQHDDTTALFLESGAYHLKIDQAGSILYDADLYVAAGQRYDYEIAAPASTTQSSAK